MHGGDEEQEIDERYVEDVPEAERVLRLLEIGDAPDEQRAFGREPHQRLPLPFGQAAGRKFACEATQPETQADFAEQQPRHGQPIRSGIGDRAHAVEPRSFPGRALQVFDQPIRLCVEIRSGEFGAAQRRGDTDEQVPSDEAGEHHDDHGPVGGRDDAVELERGMERDENRAEDAAEQVHLEPRFHAARPCPADEALAQHVEERDEHHHRAEDAKGLPEGAGRSQGPVHALVAAHGEWRGVVVPAAEAE